MAAHRGMVQPGSIIRPPAAADWLSKVAHAKVGLALAAVGITVVLIGLVFSFIEAAAGADRNTADFLTFSALAQGSAGGASSAGEGRVS